MEQRIQSTIDSPLLKRVSKVRERMGLEKLPTEILMSELDPFLLYLVRKEGELRASTDWKLIGSYWTNKKVNGRSGTTGTFSFCWKKREARRGKPAEQQSANASATA